MPTKVSPSLRAAVLLVCLLLAQACSARTAPCLSPSLTAAQQAHATEVARLREIQRGAQIVKRVGDLMVSLSKGEIAFYAAGRIPRDTHFAIQGAFEVAADMVIKALDVAKDATKPAGERLDGITRALDIVSGIKASVVDRLPDGDAKLSLGLILATAETLLLTWNVGS